ncbi:hypothetical protein [Pseudoxanthomonas sp. 10H]|uniref:hypothetical protein n=1 Tax=Pseudoxanthomonas sp. 10H TaxID=3242729 RepID=UPI0035575FDB
MSDFTRDPGSFRDPSGYVFSDGERVLRTLGERGRERYEAARASGLLEEACARGLIIASQVAPGGFEDALRGARGEKPLQVIEHPRIPVITYPYEWTFTQLRDAALQHLRLQLLALEYDFELSDATAYNMQFGTGQALPLHIDVLSIRPYRPGAPWEGYNQFCRQFLFPLLLEGVGGVAFQRWYRGSLNGLELEDIRRLIPAWRRYTSLNLLLHVQAQASAVGRATSSDLAGEAIRLPRISKVRYRAMLEGLRDWVGTLTSGRPRKTYWADYAGLNSYEETEKREKLAFVEKMSRRWQARLVLDVGGNSGDYSTAVLAGGAVQAVCLDADLDALEGAYCRRSAGTLGLLPLVMDWSDPSPGQGWGLVERAPLRRRIEADMLLALAVMHHITIGGNVPLEAFVEQLFAHGKSVVVEYVPKQDRMVQGLLRSREDIFPDYTREGFECILQRYANIEEICSIRDDGRVLFACRPR